MPLFEGTRGDQSVHAGHRNVHDHEFRLDGLREIEGRLSVGGLGSHRHVWLTVDQQLQTLPHDRVIIKRLEEERKTASGIVIPDTAAEKPDQGEVLAVGPGKRNEDGKLTPVDLKVGDKVLFGKYSGTTVKVEGDELLVMREEDIMAVVN